MKAAARHDKTHNPSGEIYWVSRLRENLTSGSYGEGLETGRSLISVPRQSFTRQLFFKWIKQHLRIKSFFGTSENSVKSQIWIAISVYVLVAIIKKRPNLKADLYTILQILSLTLLEKASLKHILTGGDCTMEDLIDNNQLNLFDNLTGQ